MTVSDATIMRMAGGMRTMRSVSWSNERRRRSASLRKTMPGWSGVDGIVSAMVAPAGPIASPQPGAIYDGLCGHHGRQSGAAAIAICA